jgi:hypothetical protein
MKLYQNKGAEINLRFCTNVKASSRRGHHAAVVPLSGEFARPSETGSGPPDSRPATAANPCHSLPNHRKIR